MNATIIYLKDGNFGKVEVVVEIIGKPNQSFVISKDVLNLLANDPVTDFVKANEFTQEPPTEWLQ